MDTRAECPRGGTRYVHQTNNGEQIRVQPGDPNDSNAAYNWAVLRNQPMRAGERSNSLTRESDTTTERVIMTFEPMIRDLAEVDYTGLWELVWRVQTVMEGSVPSDLIAQLHRDVEDLVHRGKITLFRGTSFAGEEEAIPEEQAARLIVDPGSWEPPTSTDVHVRVLTRLTQVVVVSLVDSADGADEVRSCALRKT